MSTLLRSLAFASVTLPCFVSCGRVAPRTEDKPTENKAASVRVTPSELLTAELKHSDRDLDLHSGCVKLEYSGPEFPAKAVILEWRNGKSTNEALWFANIKGSTEICFAVREVVEAGNSQFRLVVHKGGGSSSSFRIELPDPRPDAYRSPSLSVATEVEVPGEVAVWAILYKESGSGGIGPLEDQAKEADWALVGKLVFGPRANP